MKRFIIYLRAFLEESRVFIIVLPIILSMIFFLAIGKVKIPEKLITTPDAQRDVDILFFAIGSLLGAIQGLIFVVTKEIPFIKIIEGRPAKIMGGIIISVSLIMAIWGFLLLIVDQ